MNRKVTLNNNNYVTVVSVWTSNHKGYRHTEWSADFQCYWFRSASQIFLRKDDIQNRLLLHLLTIIQGVPRNMTFNKSLFLVKTSFCFIILYFEINFNITYSHIILLLIFGIKQLNKLWKKNILNYSPTVMFRGTPCMYACEPKQMILLRCKVVFDQDFLRCQFKHFYTSDKSVNTLTCSAHASN